MKVQQSILVSTLSRQKASLYAINKKTHSILIITGNKIRINVKIYISYVPIYSKSCHKMYCCDHLYLSKKFLGYCLCNGTPLPSQGAFGIFIIFSLIFFIITVFTNISFLSLFHLYFSYHYPS